METEEAEDFTIDKFKSTESYRTRLLFAHIIQFVIISALLGYLSIIVSNKYYWLARTIQLVSFVCLGFLHVHLLKNRFQFINPKFSFKNLKVPSFLAVIILVVLLILYFLQAKNMLFMALASSCAFFLPSIVFNSWLVFMSFPKTHRKVWYDFENIKDNRVTIYLNSIPVSIKLTKKYFDVEEEVFITTFPGHIAFGRVFNRFLISQNEDGTIEIYDKNKNIYGWVFFVESLKGKRYIDPDLTLRENKVKENSTIVAKRVKKEVELEKSFQETI